MERTDASSDVQVSTRSSRNTRARRSAARRRAAKAAVPLLAAVAALVGTQLATSGAWFTTTTPSPNHAFSVGVVDLGETPATSVFTGSAMYPGAATYGLITLANTGSNRLPYRYSIQGSSTGGLASVATLEAKVQTNATSCNASSYAGNGTQVVAAQTLATTTVLGNPATGQQTGDRTVAAAATEWLCFKVTLPSSAADTTQGLSANTTLTFSAEQSRNT